MNISEKELTCLVDSLCDFLKTFDQASQCIQITPPKHKVEIGSKKSKDNLFAHYYNDINEHPNRQIRLSFRIGNISCVFSIKKFDLHGNQFILTEFVNLNHREIHHLYKNRYYVANKCEIIESNYDVKCIHPWLWVWQKHYYSHWGRVLSKYKVFKLTLPAQKDFSISRQERLTMSAMRFCVPDAQYSFWRSNKFLFLVVWPRGLHFWREPKISSRCYWRCLLSWQVPTERNAKLLVVM